jgi:hypothetical protein
MDENATLTRRKAAYRRHAISRSYGRGDNEADKYIGGELRILETTARY